MPPDLRKYRLLLAFIAPAITSFAQDSIRPVIPLSLLSPDSSSRPAEAPLPRNARKIVIGDILINGNKKTRNYVIERELPFKRGDSMYISTLVSSFSFARSRLIATRLFVDVIISLKSFRGFLADIQIEVKERWYIFPLPYIRPVDRNFAAWAEKNYSLSRIDYGLKYSQYNFTGRNDNLRIWLITGYSQQVELAYDLPFVDKSLKHGFGFGFSYAKLKEIDAYTLYNQQQFISSDTIPYASSYLKEQLTFSLRYYYRPGLKTRHFIRFSVNQVNIDSAVTVYNPDYFNNNQTRVFYPELSYSVTYNNVDYPPYPLNGFLFEAGALHRGINADMNLWQLYGKTTNAWPIAKKINFITQNMGMIRAPFNQPFYNSQLIGYGDFYLRGLEKYVVDGVVGVLGRNTMARELVNFNIPFIQSSWSHDKIPIRIFAKTYVDWGYAFNKEFRNNSLVNTFLYSGGFGIDMVTFYDLVFRFEYSFNQLGESGIFFHIRNDF